jgi:cysteine synthase B
LCKQFPDKYYNPDQYSNETNKLTHYFTTAEEIWRQTNGKITHFVSAIGTSGTIMGVGMGLRKKNSAIKIVEAHPVEGHYIQGLKSMKEAIVPSLYDPDEIDVSIKVETEAAFEMTRQIVAQEAIFVGMSSGAAMLAALEVSKNLDSGTVLVMLPDRGEKYLSTPLFGVSGEA